MDLSRRRFGEIILRFVFLSGILGFAKLAPKFYSACALERKRLGLEMLAYDGSRGAEMGFEIYLCEDNNARLSHTEVVIPHVVPSCCLFICPGQAILHYHISLHRIGCLTCRN